MRRLTKREGIIAHRCRYVTVTIWLDGDVLQTLRATGDGWQTRINDTLRLAGRV